MQKQTTTTTNRSDCSTFNSLTLSQQRFRLLRAMDTPFGCLKRTIGCLTRTIRSDLSSEQLMSQTTMFSTSTTTSKTSTLTKYKNNQHQQSNVFSMHSTSEFGTFQMQGVPEPSSRTFRKMKGRAFKSSHVEEENWAKQITPI